MRTVRVLPRPRPATRNLSLFDSNGGGKTPIGLPKWARLHALKGTGALFKYHRVGIGPCHMLVTEIIVQIVFVAVQTLFLVLATTTTPQATGLDIHERSHTGYLVYLYMYDVSRCIFQ